jgi:hypothetical protein
MNCDRAAIVLRGLEKNELAVTADEIEELLALGLAVEADPEDLATLGWLRPFVVENVHRDVDDPSAREGLALALRELEEELKKDWYRMKTSKAELAAQEERRIHMRRALAHLGDRLLMQRLVKLVQDARQLAPGTRYVCCDALGSEYYAITYKGWRVRRHLKLRLERFAQAPLKSFLHTLEKTEAKMRAFSGEIATLSQNIGYVRKNREQTVIGLAKMGVPAAQALAAYQAGMRVTNHAPDVAVTCARNAKTFGSAADAARRLGHAQAALRKAGFPGTPVVMGAAKSLLAFDPPASGVPRFVDLYQRLQRIFGQGDIVYKHTSRLMPADGTPEAIVKRVVTAGHLLGQTPSANPHAKPHGPAVALASMVRAEAPLPNLVARFRAIEYELVRAGVSTALVAEADALECVACPGSPAEVVDIVASLANAIAAQHGRQRERGDVLVAVSFAKRFAF